MKYEDIVLTADMRHVANLLKTIVNQYCAEGFNWYPPEKIGQMPSLWETNLAIRKLDEMGELRSLTIFDDREE